MNEAQITELFISAAEVDRKLPDTARPKTLKAINHGYVHDIADINGWDEKTQNEEWRWKWLNPANMRNSTNDMGLWSAAMEVIKLCPDENQRRALWAWARAEAGGKSFSKWCKADGNGQGKGISRQLGLYRKERAVLHIASAFDRKPLQHNDFPDESDFTNTPEIGDKSDIITVWRPDESKPVCGFDRDLEDFSWFEAQKQRRREREARRKAA